MKAAIQNPSAFKAAYPNKPVQIFALNASPRRDGNTAWAARQILEGAKAQGAGARVYHSSRLDIKPCRGCFGCKKGDRGCIVKDDMQGLYKPILQADALVLATPVYMGQVSAQLKLFIDRLFPIFSPRFSPYFKEDTRKKLLLVFTQGNPDRDKFSAYYDYTKRMFELLEFDTLPVQIIGNARSEPAWEQQGLGDHLKSIGASLFSQ